MKKRDEYIKSLEARVESIAPETLRQAKVKTVISRPMPEVYEAAIPVLTRPGTLTAVTPTPPKLANDMRRFWIIYMDTEPIYHQQKPIEIKEDLPMGMPAAGLDIYVTVLLEAKGPGATTVYFYPHNRICSNIPEDLQKVVDENMIYRGKVFVNRLQTQIAGQRKWRWLTR